MFVLIITFKLKLTRSLGSFMFTFIISENNDRYGWIILKTCPSAHGLPSGPKFLFILIVVTIPDILLTFQYDYTSSLSMLALIFYDQLIFVKLKTR
ncbi:hypothetical protein DERF_004771 [Dermatophagoides farinae]|uniref:Uncharacterized protein n=1 Tax=Dermatophagoides farinae TaxID=6954 RepID=A0A922LAH3_DERFA|nr:hypothetical protein DERF_004771 [Dermatophagoides farinae]